MYTSTFKTESPVIFKCRKSLMFVQKWHQYRDLSNGQPIEDLTCSYKNMSPDIPVGNLKDSQYIKILNSNVCFIKIQQIASQF